MAGGMGNAFVEGLQGGFGMGMAYRQQNLREKEAERAAEERAAQAERQNRESDLREKQINQQIAHGQAVEQRAAQKDALATIEAQQADLLNEMRGKAEQYGGYDKIPATELAPYSDRRNELSRAKAAAYQGKYGPVVEQAKQAANDLFTNIQMGRVKWQDVSDTDLAKAFMAKTGRNPTDYIGEDGRPSAVQSAVTGVRDGLQTNNMGMVIRNANAILSPELRRYFQDAGHDGNEVVGVDLHALVPDPKDPNTMHPVVNVRVRRPDGAEAQYFDGVSHKAGETADGDSMSSIKMDRALDNMHREETIAKLFESNPAMAAKVKRGTEELGKKGDNFLAIYTGLGGKKTDFERVGKPEVQDLGDRKVTVIRDQNGNVIREETRKVGARPREFAPPTARGVQATLDAISNAEDDGSITREKARELRESALSSASTGRRGVAGAGGGSAKVPESEIKGTISDAERDAANAIGVQFDKVTGGWVQRDGKPATAEQKAAMAAARAGAAKAVRDAAAKGQRIGGTQAAAAASEGAKAAPPAPAASKFKVGQIYQGANGTQARFGGVDQNGKMIWTKP